MAGRNSSPDYLLQNSTPADATLKNILDLSEFNIIITANIKKILQKTRIVNTKHVFVEIRKSLRISHKAVAGPGIMDATLGEWPEEWQSVLTDWIFSWAAFIQYIDE